jgi:two-component system, OmpR family, response regulator
MQLLIVEDDARMSSVLQEGLEEEGHVITVAESGTEGLAFARATRFDAIVLDVMLPGLDGLTVARKLRSEGNQTPILMLTARDRLPDVVGGLDSGADDYLAKPFSFEELLARLRAVSRRGPIPQPVLIRVADLVLNTATRTVSRGLGEVTLTRTEYELLEILARRAGQVVTREALITGVWGFDKDVEANTLDTFMHMLRTKVDHGYATKLIQTLRGVGYCLRGS